MNNETKKIKEILYNKDVSKIMDFTPTENASFEIHFLDMFFKEFLGDNNKNIDSKKFLSGFSKVFSEFIFLNGETDNLLRDMSIEKLFPSCGTHIDTKYGTELSCERYDHCKEDLIRKDIHKGLNKLKAYIYTESKKTSDVISNKLISLIWKEAPRDKDQLQYLIGHEDKFLKKYSTKKNYTYFEAILKIIENAKKKDFTNWTSYWERGQICKNKTATSLHLDQKYIDFHFNDWLHHYGQSKKVNDKYIMPLNSFGHKMAAFINRLKEINEILNCHSCQGRIIPDWNYGHHSFDSYRVTVFKCHNSSCDKKGKGIYINHCTGCHSIIDARDNLNKCENGPYVCKHCHACCKNKESHSGGSCPECHKYELVTFYGHHEDKINVACFNCDFKITTKEISENSKLGRFRYLTYLNTSSAALDNKRKSRKKYSKNRPYRQSISN
jgi:hypothetical protein